MQKKPALNAFIDAAPDAKTAKKVNRGGRPPIAGRAKNQRAVVNLTPAQAERIASRAAELGVSKSAVVSLAVASYFAGARE